MSESALAGSTGLGGVEHTGPTRRLADQTHASWSRGAEMGRHRRRLKPVEHAGRRRRPAWPPFVPPTLSSRKWEPVQKETGAGSFERRPCFDVAIPRTCKAARASFSLATILWTLLVLASVIQGASGVTVTEVRLQTETATQDQFVLEGEPANLVCFFQLKPNEEIRRVTWLKDGTDEVYVWRRRFQPLARLLFRDRTDLSNRSPSFVKIDSAHRFMQGNYTCRVETDKGVSENDFYLIVIVDACKEQSWTTYSDRIGCTEEIRLDCKGMHPRPSPACGVYNEATQSYLTTVPFDSVQLVNGTYDVHLRRTFRIKDWIAYKSISFRCHVIVLGTEWRTGMTHRLFGDSGCLRDPPPVRNGSFNLTGDQTCWGTPADGAVVRYSCPAGRSLRDAHHKMVCRNGTWLGVVGRRNLDRAYSSSPDGVVSCEEDGASSLRSCTFALLVTLLLRLPPFTFWLQTGT